MKKFAVALVLLGTFLAIPGNPVIAAVDAGLGFGLGVGPLQCSVQKCKYCGKAFADDDSGDKLLISHLGECPVKKLEKSKVQQKRPAKKITYCFYCKKDFPDNKFGQWLMKRHMKKCEKGPKKDKAEKKRKKEEKKRKKNEAGNSTSDSALGGLDAEEPESAAGNISTDSEAEGEDEETDGYSGPSEGTVKGTYSSLNVRDCPWGKVLGSLKDSDKVRILGEEKDDKGVVWYQISYNGGKGYVHSDYIGTGSAASPGSTGGSSGPSGSPSGGSAPGGNQNNGSSSVGPLPADALAGAPGAAEALHWASVTSLTAVNPNTGQGGTDGSQWSMWCLGHVARCWSIGAGKTVPLLQAGSAKIAYNNFKNAGKIKAIPGSGPIPAGSPVFWETQSEWGHVAIATGRVDSRGVPTVIDNYKGIKEKPIDQMCSKPISGWGVVDGTPIT